MSQLKGRGEGKAFSVLIRDKFVARKIAHFDEETEKLLGVFWPGPVTFILPARDRKLARSLGPYDFIGLRCSCHPLVQHLVNQLTAPLVTTSANQSGFPPARHLSDLDWLPKDVMVCCEEGSEISGSHESSLVVKVEGRSYFILRESKSHQSLFEIAAGELGFSCFSGHSSS